MDLEHLRLFLTIVEKGSMAAAAREHRVSPATVSERLAALEADCGATLLHRTTRTLGLTDAGRTLLEGARAVLDHVAELRDRVQSGEQTLSGPIRVGAPSDLGRALVARVANGFLAAYPTTSIELLLSDGYVNVIDQGLDVAVRYGRLADSTLRVRRLGSHRRLVCAAPSYLRKHGEPKKPADLRSHNCIAMRWGLDIENVWQFRVGRKAVTVLVEGDRIADDSDLVREWAVAGYGIISKSELDVRDDLQAGRLVPLLERFPSPPVEVQLVFPPSRTHPRRVDALADALAAAIRDPDPKRLLDRKPSGRSSGGARRRRRQ